MSKMNSLSSPVTDEASSLTKYRLVTWSSSGTRRTSRRRQKGRPINALGCARASVVTLASAVPLTAARPKVLRISIQDGAGTTTLKFEGKLVGLWVNELNRVWHAFEPSLGMKKLCLDMRGMTFVDEKGTKALRKIFRSTEAEILADTPLTRHFAAETMRKMPQNDGKEI